LKFIYNKLWKLLVDRKMNKTKLGEIAKMSHKPITRLSQDKTVNTQVLIKICAALKVQPGDIMEFVDDDGENDNVQN